MPFKTPVLGILPLAIARDILRSLAPRTSRRRGFGLGASVGRDRANEPDDVALIETMLRQTGDLNFRSDHEPTGLFSVLLDQATRRFQRRKGLGVDGTFNPDGETIQALERESFAGQGGDERRRQTDCFQNRVQLGNKQIQLDRAIEKLEQASATLTALSEEAARLDSRLLEAGMQLGISAIANFVPVVRAIRLGLGIAAALRAFARGQSLDAAQIALVSAAQEDAGDLADRVDDAVQDLEFRQQNLQRRQGEESALRQSREALGCG